MSDTIILALKCASLPFMVIVVISVICWYEKFKDWLKIKRRDWKNKSTGRDVEIIVGRARSGKK